MASFCKDTLAVRVMVAVQIALAVFTLVVWSQHAQHSHKEDVVTVRCRNLLPERTAAVMNGVLVPAGAVRSVPVSRSAPNLVIQLVVTGRPLNQALNVDVTVQVPPRLLNAPRILLALEYLKRRTGTSCEDCETGFVCLTSPSAILGYLGFNECPPSLKSLGLRLHSEPTLSTGMAAFKRGVEE